MNRAIFLDRDGTLNVPDPSGYLSDPDKLELLPGVVEGLRMLQEAGYLLIVVSNQSCVAKGIVSIEQVWSVNDRLVDELQRHGIEVAEVYFCPHDDDDGCLCRKPAAGMLLEAAEAHDLELSECWMVGDQDRDVEAGRVVGCHVVLLDGYTMKEAAEYIL
jgi:histidinol-phosphate phosphatase family protein